LYGLTLLVKQLVEDILGVGKCHVKSFEGSLYQISEDAYAFIIRNTSSISKFIKTMTMNSATTVFQFSLRIFQQP
jgi:hypothetical protein